MGRLEAPANKIISADDRRPSPLLQSDSSGCMTAGDGVADPVPGQHLRAAQTVLQHPDVISLWCCNINGLSTSRDLMNVAVSDGEIRDEVVAAVDTRLALGQLLPELNGYRADDVRQEVPSRHAQLPRGVNGICVWMKETDGRLAVVEKHHRIVWMRIAGDGSVGCRPTYVAFAYGPHCGLAPSEREAFWSLLASGIAKWVAAGDVVVMGDLNARLGPDMGDTADNANAGPLRALCETHRMVIVNRQWAPGIATWRRSNEQPHVVSMIDYVLVHEDSMDRVVGMEVVDYDVGSDHWPLRLRWYAPVVHRDGHPPVRPPHLRRWRNGNDEKWKRYGEMVEEGMTEKWQRARQCISMAPPSERVEQLWRAMKAVVCHAADRSLGRATAVRPHRQLPDPALRSAVRRRRQAYADWVRLRSASGGMLASRDNCDRAYSEWLRLTKWVRVLARRCRLLRDRARIMELESKRESDPTAFFRLINTWRRGQAHAPLPVAMQAVSAGQRRWTHDTADTVDAWAEYFSTLGTDAADGSAHFDDDFRGRVARYMDEVRATGAPRSSAMANDGMAADVSADEVRDAIARLHKRKARDSNGFANEMIIHGGELMADAVRDLLNVVWSAACIPRDWRLGLTVPIYKQHGARSDMNSYRGISLMSVFMKLYESIICRRVEEHIEATGSIGEEQAGFRRGRNCYDQVFVLTEVVADRAERGLHTFLAFLDISKAYDRTWRDGLLLHLLRAGVQGQMWDVIADMYSALYHRVMVNGIPSREFASFIGVAQGSCLSPLLFVIFISDVIREWRAHGLGVRIRGMEDSDPIAGLLFADDIVLVADSESELQRALDILSRHARHWRYRFNHDKCAVLVMGKRGDSGQQSWTLDGGVVARQKFYKYLGMWLQTGGTRALWDRWADASADRGKACAGALGWCGARQGALAIETGMAIVRAIMWPLMDYGAELVGESANKERDLTQHRFARQLLGVPNGCTNAMLRAELGWLSMAARVDVAMLRYLHRLQAMPDDRLVRRVFVARFAQRQDIAGARGFCVAVRRVLARYGLGHHYATTVHDSIAHGVGTSSTAPKLRWKRLVGLSVATRESEQLAEVLRNRDSDSARWYCRVVGIGGVVVAADALRVPVSVSGSPRSYLLRSHGGSDATQQRGRRITTQLRTSTLPLRGLALTQRVSGVPLSEFDPHCHVCDRSRVEDQSHFISECSAYSAPRHALWLFAASAYGPAGSWAALTHAQRALWLLSSDVPLVCRTRNTAFVAMWSLRNTLLAQPAPIDDDVALVREVLVIGDSDSDDDIESIDSSV
jgi:hypothetical protein